MADYDEFLKTLQPVQNQDLGSMDASYENIQRLLSGGDKTYSGMTMPAVLPLLTTESDPYLQEYIKSLRVSGEDSKKRAVADVTTESLKRGITGSNIEMGTIGDTVQGMEQTQEQGINQLLAQESAGKQQQLVNFLKEAYGIDFSAQAAQRENVAGAMGEKMNLDAQMKMFQDSLDAQKTSWWQDLAPSIIGATGSILGGPIGGAAATAIGNLFKKKTTTP